jgi:hypothetical protein
VGGIGYYLSVSASGLVAGYGAMALDQILEVWRGAQPLKEWLEKYVV